MSKKKRSESGDSNDVSRRSFMKTAALGAGAMAAASGSAHAAITDAAGAPIKPSEDIEAYLKGDLSPMSGPGFTEFPMNGAAVFANACREEGLAGLFCCPGNYAIVSAIASAGIPTYGGRTEGPMTSAADAFTRVSGEIAAASGTEGPGFTNMICAIAAAKACRTPLLVLASNMDFALDDTENRIQRGYQQPTTEGLKKYGKRIVQKERVHEYAGYAFRALRTGVPGPVHLDFTREADQEEIESALDLGFTYYGKSQYRTESRPHPDPKSIESAIDLIKKAQRPMIVASTGVFYSKAWDALAAFAEKAQIPVVETGPQRGKFSDADPLQANTANDAILSVDLAILVGQYCMPTVGEFKFPPDCKFIRIDPDPEDIGRNLPIDVGIVSCEKAALEALADLCPKLTHDTWIAEVAAARDAFEAQNEEYYQLGLKYSTDTSIHPAVFSKQLADFLYAGDIAREQTPVVSGGYGVAKYSRRYIRAFRPGQICNGAYQYGSIGPDVGYTVGVGAACKQEAGAQNGYADTPIVCITGDAGFGYSGMEVETLTKYRIPGIIIVYNNNAWGTWPGFSRNKQVAHVHQFQENLRYDQIAMALGGHGEYVHSADMFLPALQRAWDVAMNERRPTVINCQAMKEYHLRGEYPPGMPSQLEPGCAAYNH